MTVQRKHQPDRRSGEFNDREAIVTYSRVGPEEPGSLHGVDGREPAGPLYEAVEVPHIDRPQPHEPRLSASDMRSEPDYGPDLDPLAPEERTRGFRHLIFIGIGIIALAAGVGILVATIGSSGRIETAAPGAVPAASEAADTVTTAPTVRAIPLGDAPGGPAIDLTPAAPASEVEAATVTPPEPRLRPELPTDNAAVAPEAAEPAVAGSVAPAAETAAAPVGEDDFIRRIEQTLSGIAGAPAAGTLPADAPIAEPVTAATAPIDAELSPDTILPADTGPLPVRVLPDGTVVFEDETFNQDAAAIDGGGHFDFELETPPAATTAEAAPAIPAVPDQPSLDQSLVDQPLFDQPLSDQPLILDGATLDIEPNPQLLLPDAQFVPPEDIPTVPETIGLE